MAVYEKWATIKYGAFTVGKDGSGYDVKLYGATSGNYLLWDESGDDLLLVGTATQLAVAGTTASTSPTTGSLRTAGGLGVAGEINCGNQIAFNTSVDSAAVADEVAIGSYEISAGHRALAISSEEVVVTAAAGASDNYLPVQINGATYKLLLHS